MADVPIPTGWRRLRQRTADVLFSRDRDDRLTRRVDVALIVLISLNVVAVIVESMDGLDRRWAVYFAVFDTVSVIIFTIEYLLRLWSAVDDPWRDIYRHPVYGRLRFARTTMALVDLLAILPFYLGMFVTVDLRFLRVLRLLRIFKLTRYSGSMTLLFQVFRQEARTVGAAMFVLLMLLVISSSLAFIIEHGAHGDSEAFSSIPQAMYWAIVTMTTVGYGDVVPATPLGKILGAVIAIIGLGMVALPAGILASGFGNALQRRRTQVEERIESMLIDGDLSEQEQAELDELAQRLDLSDADLRSLVQTVYHERNLQAGPSFCPHCGGDLRPQPSAGGASP